MSGVSTCYYFNERHILYGKLRPYLNKVALPNFSGRCSTELVPLFPINGNCREFLAYLLRKNETIEYIMKEKTGSRMPRANMKYLLSMKIPVPPIEEQERIAKIIETKITAVEKAKKANEEQLFLLYQLIYAYFSKTFDNNYEKYLLSNLTLPIENISSKDNGFIEYIDISSIDNINKKIISTHKISIDNAPSRAKQITINNDILVSTVRPNLNAVAINNIESKNTIVCSTGYCVLRCNDKIDYKYLFYFCLSKYFIDYLTNLAKGSSYPAVVNDDVLSCFIPLPSINEQCEIVKTLDSKYKLYKKLNTFFTKQSEYINALPSSILRKAFNGEY